MTFRVDIDLHGMRALQELVLQSSSTGRKAFEAACFLYMQDVIDLALPMVRVDTGRLRDSAYAERKAPRMRAGFAAPHAHLIHGGAKARRQGSGVNPGFRGDFFLQKAWIRLASEMGVRLMRHWQTAMKAGWTIETAPARHKDKRPRRARRKSASAAQRRVSEAKVARVRKESPRRERR